MILQVSKGAILLVPDSELARWKDRDVVIHKDAIVVAVPDDSTLRERMEAYRELRESMA